MPQLLTCGQQTKRGPERPPGGRLQFGMVADFKSERRPGSNRNPRPDCVGIRTYDDPARPEAAIWSAAGAASLDATILRAPLGLATTIGERGVRLSGGQKQRTALARGIIRTAPVLLLDDCFSALDAETEAQIFDEICHLRCGLTTLFVSHRVSTTRRADRILVLDNGVLVESGSPDVLGSAGGRYADLCAQQASREKEMAQ